MRNTDTVFERASVCSKHSIKTEGKLIHVHGEHRPDKREEAVPNGLKLATKSL